MLASTSNSEPRRKSAALEIMLSSLDTAGDLLSGSECSSPATSPVQRSDFTFRPQSSEQQRGRNEKSRLGLSSPEPIDIVRDFLTHMSEPHVAKQFIAEDAKVECHSVMVRGEEDKKEAAQAAQGDLYELLASSSRCDTEIDGIFACGEDVAAFGHFEYLDGPSSLPQRNMHFSIWACVDVVREKIVGFQWLDQIARAEDECVDRRR